VKNILWLFKWMLKAAIFFTLFAFALNNEQPVTVHFFFGNFWQAPLVLVVLLAFSVGVGVGVLGMIPWRWKQRRPTGQAASTTTPASPAPTGDTATLLPPAYSDGL